MGREAECMSRWPQGSGKVKLHLDSESLTVRGSFRAVWNLAELGDVSANQGDLLIQREGQTVAFELGQAQAQSWAKKLLAPTPTLAEKLGISRAKVYICGHLYSADLRAATEGHVVSEISEAGLVIAEVGDYDQLESAIASLKFTQAKTPIWIVHGKGKNAFNGDLVRVAMRNTGYMDNKVCGVSNVLSATRFSKMSGSACT